MTEKQTTLRNKVSCAGVGLHSGKQINMVIAPAAANTGIVFKRLDVAKEKSLIPARFYGVCETRLGTTVKNDFGVKVATVEHLMAALWGVGVDNAIIELDGVEIPIMDGSSEQFVFMLECAGIKELGAPKKVLRVLKTVEVRDGDSVVRISPNTEGETGLDINIAIDFPHPVIGKQNAQYDFRDITFKQSVSRARTFGFEHEVNALRAMGLALGGSLENAIVIGKENVLNKDGLRYTDEFVRHKALDLVGDMFLAGAWLDAKIDASRPSHHINNLLLRALFADSTAYVIEDAGAEIPAIQPLEAARELEQFAV